MNFSQVVYLISCVLLWICIAINIGQLRRNRKLSDDYVEAIATTYKARDNYEQLCQNLDEERNYFRKLREAQEVTEK